MATRTRCSDKAACVQLLLNKLWPFPFKRELGVCVFFFFNRLQQIGRGDDSLKAAHL